METEKYLLDNGFELLKGFRLGYKINQKGQLWSCWYSKIMKPMSNDDGYLYFKLSGGHIQKATLHRLLALQYIPNPNNLPQVDHIDRNKLNNNLENLRWVTQAENRHNRPIKGALFSWKQKGFIYWRASYVIERNMKPITKNSKDKEVCEKWLEEMKEKYPR